MQVSRRNGWLANVALSRGCFIGAAAAVLLEAADASADRDGSRTNPDRAWVLAAPPPREDSVQFAARLGGVSWSGDIFGSQLEVVAGGGYKQGANNYFGGYGAFGIGSVGAEIERTCPPNSTCSGRTTSFRFGAEFQRHFLPGERFNPWFGIGLGYARAAATYERPSLNAVDAVAAGLDVRVMLAIDIRVSETFALGPVIDAGFGPGLSGEVTDGIGGKRGLPEDVGRWGSVGWRFVVFP